MYDVIIIGGGCAGLSAGIYTGRANLKTLIFANDFDNKGGLLVKTFMVENYPGFSNGILGFDLMQEFEQQALKFGSEMENSKIIHVERENGFFRLLDDQSRQFLTKTIIVATGSTPNKLLLPFEDFYWGKGISSCAVCDGALYKNKRIIVIGAGDSACEEATFLTKFSNVTMIYRRDVFRASKAMQQKVFDNPKINHLPNTIITQLVGDDEKLTSIVCQNVITKKKTNIPVDGLFYGLGLTPNSELFQGLLEIEDGYIVKKHYKHFETCTSCPGIFVAGDVSDKVYRQAVVASGDGVKAALDVERFLSF